MLAAEQEAREKKRKAEGLPPTSMAMIENGPGEEEPNKRRRLLQEAVALDRDDDDDDDEEDKGEDGEKIDQDDEECVSVTGTFSPIKLIAVSSDDDEDSEEEDDTAELLRELEKIKRERAEEKARQVSYSPALILITRSDQKL